MKNDPNSAAETLILPETAKFLRISRSHLLNILKGKVAGVPLLPYSRVGRRLLFRRAALEQWLREVEAGTSGGGVPLVGNEQGAKLRCREAALEQWLREVEAGTSGGELPLIGNEQGANMLGGRAGLDFPKPLL